MKNILVKLKNHTRCKKFTKLNLINGINYNAQKHFLVLLDINLNQRIISDIFLKEIGFSTSLKKLFIDFYKKH